MRIAYWMTAAACAASLTGCYTYPVYQPMPVARLTPQQSAALAQQQQSQQPTSQADRDRMAADNAQVARDDQANSYAQATVAPYAYVAPAAPVYYDYPYYGYPYPYYGYYGGYYPGVTLGFSFGGFYGRGYRGGYGGYRGGFHHR
jgi:hypothetical protein